MLQKLKKNVKNNLNKATEIVSEAAKMENVEIIKKGVFTKIDTAKKEASQFSRKAKKTIEEKATIENLKNIGEKTVGAINRENITNVGSAISEVATIDNAKSVAKYASGVKGYKELVEAKRIKKIAEQNLKSAINATENRRDILNSELESYAEIKISTIKNTICVFVEYLNEIGQKNKGREYDALKSVDIKREDIKEIEEIGIQSVDLLKGAAGSTALGAFAAFGTKALVLKGVVAYGTASTGTAISSLSGIAATKATMAFLGGGSIASGGGGMAAGSGMLTGIGASAFAGAAVLAGGIILSAHGSKALTTAVKYSADVDKAISNFRKSWVLMDGIKKRVAELKNLTLQLDKRANDRLKELEHIVLIFDPNNLQHKILFQKTALLMKSIGEISNTPVLDEDGEVSEASGVIIGKMKSIANT